MDSVPRVDITEANGWSEEHVPSQLEIPALAGILNRKYFTTIDFAPDI